MQYTYRCSNKRELAIGMYLRLKRISVKLPLERAFLVVSLWFCWIQLAAQIPEKYDLFVAYRIGHKTFEAIQQQDLNTIEEYLRDTTHLSYLIQGFKSNKFNRDSINWLEDILYNQETKLFEFHVYAGKYRPHKEDKWGRYTYSFVIVLEIDLSKKKTREKIVNSTIIVPTNKLKLRQWWQNYVPSYKTPKYARKEISDKYGLVPPPPPPPETEEWYKKG